MPVKRETPQFFEAADLFSGFFVSGVGHLVTAAWESAATRQERRVASQCV